MEEVEAPAEFFDELDIEAFRSDHVAVVAPPALGGEAGLLFSTLPLRTADESGEEAPVDLGLEASEGSLEPANPLVEVEIPTQLSDGILLPDADVTVELAGEVDRGASELGDASAFYPNVATDTDLVVAAAPTGFETYTHLRSPEAPTQQRFNLDLPAGAELKETDSGGAEVVRSDGSLVLTVSPPSAVDAEGSQVPVEIDVEGRSVILSSNPDPDAAYPILVDPVFDTYDLSLANTQWTKDWVSTPNIQGFGTSWGIPYYGMNARALVGPVTPGSNAWFNYYVPRYWVDTQAGLSTPTTYIRNMKLWGLAFMMPDEMGIANQYRATYPSLQLGLWSSDQFSAYAERFGHQGQLTDYSYVFDMKNPWEDTNVKNGGFGIATWSSNNTVNRFVNVQQASVEVTDQDLPGFEPINSPSSWMDATATEKLGYAASDEGLGIHSFKVKQPKAEGGSQVITTSNNCVGNSQSYCPYESKTATRQIIYNPQSMAQGENFIEVTAADPVNHVSSPAVARIKVDHSPPAISLSGNLTEQGTVGTNLGEYILNYAARDGDSAAAVATTPAGVVGKGEGQLERPMGVATAPDGSFYVVDRLNNRVVKFDKDGEFALQFGSTGSGDGQFNDPRGIDVAPNGTVWVADFGNDRIQAFNASGAFLRKAKFSDPASEPAAIASGPGGVLWVADIGLKRLVKLSENPITTLLTTTGGYGASLVSPTGVSTDKFGNVWAADSGLGKVLEFDASGKLVFQFGAAGSGNGQIDGVVGVDVSSAGNIAVTERNNGRVQIFKPDGSYLRKFGTSGSASNQFSEAAGLSFGPNNTLVVADAGNKRITRWLHADEDPQSGAAKVEVKVDGVSVHTKAPGCTTKNCQVASLWILDADDYSGGTHKVEVIATDAVGISQTKRLDIETHGDATNPTLDLSGTMTQQGSLGATRPSYKLKVVAADPGPTSERKSGVASAVIKVDGAVVDSVSPGCPSGGCLITREWTLNSNSYSAGPHTVEVKATDAVGRSTTKTLAIEIARDTTAPEFTLSDFYTAPSGWLEQKSYEYAAVAKDPNGYGVTSVQLKIDGQAVKTLNQSCAAGSCTGYFGLGQTLDMENYDGGAHPAELIATDGAGNWKKKTWTINVVPSGNVSRTEAVATMEASDETSGANTIGAPKESAGEELPMGGDVVFEGESEGFTAPEAAAPILVGFDPDEGMTLRVPTDEVTEEPCLFREQELVEEEPSEPVPPVELLKPCDLDEPHGEDLIDREAVEITPVQTSAAATELGLDAGATVAVSANVQGNVDQLIRPLFNGTQTFMAIRDSAGPVEYSWRVELEEDQHLTLIDSKHAAVHWDSGRIALTITANKAHDAIGTELPTTISVAGDILTLHVPHRDPSPVGGSFVYPVTAGAGWQGGFQTYQVVMPPPETQMEAEEEEVLQHVDIWDNEDEGRIRLLSATPPQFAGKSENGEDKFHYKFRWSECRYGKMSKVPHPPKARREALALYVGACAKRDSDEPLLAGHTVFGWAHMIPGKWIWVNQEPRNIHCETWGKYRGTPVNCFARPWKAKEGITLRGDFRLRQWYGVLAECITMYTEIYSKKPYVDVNENIVTTAGAGDYFEKCDWPD